MFDYQGYGKSNGKPNESKLYEDAFSVWKILTEEKNINPTDITIYGKSLGGAVATGLTNKICNELKGDHVNPHGLVVESSFLDIDTMARNKLSALYPFLKIFIRNKFDSKNNLKNIGDKTKVLIAHSTNDELIGIDHGISLYKDYANKNAIFTKINGTHNFINYDPIYLEKINLFLKH